MMLREFPEIKRFHGMKIRTAGADTFIKVNIHLDPDLSLHEVHLICDRIEKEIAQRIQRSETYLHAEPQEEKHLKEEPETA